MEHDDAGRVTVLLVDSNLHACGFGTFPTLGQVLQPLSPAHGE
jgi:hypothetical protein